MGQPGAAPKVIKGRNHVAVLAGENQVSDMLVFLMYRKLQTILRSSLEQQQGPEKKQDATV